jgi:hypothetical protein
MILGAFDPDLRIVAKTDQQIPPQGLKPTRGGRTVRGNRHYSRAHIALRPRRQAS